jgi:hypothetical protein
VSTDRDVERIVRSWMDEGVTALPDRVLDLVLDQIPATPQRRAGWLARRFPIMNNTMKIALAAAAVIVLAFIGIGVLRDNAGGPPTATATPVPTATATPQPLSEGPLDAGTVVAAGLGPSESVSATFTVPAGWEGAAGSCVLPTSGNNGPDGMGICFLVVGTGLYSDPCHGSSGPADVLVGPTVEEFANALAEQTAYEATAPTDVTLSGYSGKRVDLQLPSDVASCDNGAFTPWAGSIHAQGPDNRWQLWILDVEGERMIIVSQNFPGTSSADLAEQQAIVDSISFQP